MNRKLLLLHGYAGSGKASLIRYLAMRCGDACPIIAKHDGVPFTLWARAGIVALGDYVSCTPPGGDGIPFGQAFNAVRELLQAKKKKDSPALATLVIAEGRPLACPEFIAAARKAKIDFKNFEVSTHPFSRGSRIMRKHQTDNTARFDAAAARFIAALQDGKIRTIKVSTGSAVGTEAAIQLLASAGGIILPPGCNRPIDSVTRTSRYNKYQREQNAEKSQAA